MLSNRLLSQVNKLGVANHGGSAERITAKDRLQRRVLPSSCGGSSGFAHRSQSLEQRWALRGNAACNLPQHLQRPALPDEQPEFQ